MNGKSHDDVMRSLLESETVRAHMNKVQVRLGIVIAKRRIELELTQSQLIEMVADYGISITPIQLTMMESGNLDVNGEVYKDVLATMDEIEDGFTPDERAEIIRRLNDSDAGSIPVEDVVGKDEWERIKNEPIDEDDGWE